MFVVSKVFCKGISPRFFIEQCGPFSYIGRTLSSKNSGEENFKRKLMAQENQNNQQLPMWKKRERSLKKRYGSWNPTKKLSRQNMQELRDVKVSMPGIKTIDLANMYRISPEAIRRVLKSKWIPNDNEEESILGREQKRKERKELINASKYDTKLSKRRSRSKSTSGSSSKISNSRGKKPYTPSVGDMLD